jgi:hypothetical protein
MSKVLLGLYGRRGGEVEIIGHIMAANKAWCEGCGRRRISEIMNKN